MSEGGERISEPDCQGEENGPRITVKAKQTKKTDAVVLMFVSTPLRQAAPQLGHVLRPPRHPEVSQGRLMGWEFVYSGFCLFFVFFKQICNFYYLLYDYGYLFGFYVYVSDGVI